MLNLNLAKHVIYAAITKPPPLPYRKLDALASDLRLEVEIWQILRICSEI